MSHSLSDLLNLYDASASLERAHTIPAPWYLDRRIEQAEREEVFGANWIAVGRIDQVAVEGQFFTVEIAGEPLVVVRGSDRELRAFFNVCRHHAAAVANVPCGTVEHLRCPYHGWTYGLDGSLKGAPEFAGVCNFDRGANGLLPVRVGVWEQFIFITLDAGASALMTSLGDLPGRVATLGLDDLLFSLARHTHWNATGRFTWTTISTADTTCRICTKA
jgi:choline monooxygenase